MKSNLRIASLFLLLLPAIIILRVYLFELYSIPSSSMTPTLLEGDFIIVNKMSYGPRVVQFWKLISEKKLDYTWHTNTDKIKKGDVFVFNWPNYLTLNDKDPNMFGSVIVKRCFGMPKDTVLIDNKTLNTLGVIYEGNNEFDKPDLFPHDSTLNWTVSKYGPLWVPAKGKTVALTTNIATHYKDVLLYEGNRVTSRNDSVFINNEYTSHYTFKFNYYFMKGDNFYGSMDSRFWGFVPERNIIGKVSLVLFSIDPNQPWYKAFRWNRFLKILE